MDRTLVILIGGLLPAFAFGISAIFQKAAVLNGVGPGTYIIVDGLAMLACGLIVRLVLNESTWLSAGTPWALLGGLLFAIAAGSISFALQRLAAPLSLIAPITVISTLVTVVLSFIVFHEHEGIDAVRRLGGALLVVAGAALVATS